MGVNDSRTPRLLIVIIILLMLPLIAFPALLSRISEGYRTIMWCYPFYVLGSGLLASLCYPSRREVTYILLFVLVLSHLAIWMLPYAK
ncbi:MAG: hypothetical protein IJY31_05135 [Muribaculaceae bacterium]|nr:hypothetical protein [Muribaculaceae bacterium]